MVISLYPIDANGIPFTVAYFASTGDPLADLSEDMATEQKPRATYENLINLINLINLTNDQDIIDVLLFLRQREIIDFERFKELYEEYKKSQCILASASILFLYQFFGLHPLFDKIE